MQTSNVISGFLIGIVFFILNEYISVLAVGKIFSVIVACYVIYQACISVVKGLVAFLIVSMLSGKEDRTLSTLKTLDDTNVDVDYFSFFTTNIGGLNLYIWVLFALGTISVVRLALRPKVKISGDSINLLVAFIVLGAMVTIATVLDLPLRSTVEYKYLVSDIRPMIIFFIAIILMVDLKQSSLGVLPAVLFINIMTLLALSLTVQMVATLANDLYQGELRFQFNVSPHVLLPFFFVWVLTSRYLGTTVGVSSFVGGFKIARGEMLNFGISVLMLIVFFRKLSVGMQLSQKLGILKAVLMSVSIFGLVGVWLSLQYPYLADFIIFKFSFFIDLMSGEGSSSSVSMRVTELMNIISFYMSNATALLWGRGFGGSFTFTDFPPERLLVISDFSLDQINAGVFYKPHHFVNYILLKAGIIGLFMYLLFSYRFITLGFQLVRIRDPNCKILGYYLFFFSLYSLNMYWQPVLIVWALFVYSLGEIGLRRLNSENCTL